MKFAVLLGLLLSASICVRAEQLTGFLSDAKCAAAGKGGSAGHAACAKKCVQGGEAVVLVTPDKVYKLNNQEKVKNHVGEKVTLEGKLDGDTLSVEKGRPAE
jgi:hypothetical protein